MHQDNSRSLPHLNIMHFDTCLVSETNTWFQHIQYPSNRDLEEPTDTGCRGVLSVASPCVSGASWLQHTATCEGGRNTPWWAGTQELSSRACEVVLLVWVVSFMYSSIFHVSQHIGSSRAVLTRMRGGVIGLSSILHLFIHLSCKSTYRVLKSCPHAHAMWCYWSEQYPSCIHPSFM